MGTKNLFYVVVFCLFACTSCTTTNKVAYFQSTQDTTYRQMLGSVEAPFQQNDFISISISSASPEASAIFNPYTNPEQKAAAGTAKNAQYFGHLVDIDGYIELPVLGKIKAEGMTKTQLKNYILKTILDKKMLIDPIVDIRHGNFEVTIMGEVGNPSVINVASEKISLVKALAMAGDLTIYGRRDNILLIREEGGARKTRHLNINSGDFLNSEFYYLKPNDVVYVEPNKTKIAVTGRSQQILPLVLTGISILVLVMDRVFK
jgi:polysaccharide biosynthesis/export protein